MSVLGVTSVINWFLGKHYFSTKFFYFVGNTRITSNRMDSKEGVEALFLFATEGILVTNDQGLIIRANPSAERLFQYPKDGLIGLKIEELIPRRFRESHVKTRDNYIGTPHARSMGQGMDLYGMRSNGEEFPVEVSLSPYTSALGRFVIAFIIDITIRKSAEEKQKNYSIELERQVKNRTLILEEAVNELERTKMELNEALEKEKELNELKSRFVSMASHEFRTPLATILSSLSLVKKYGEQQDKENQDRHIKRIKSSINNLTDILNDFLSVSRMEEGRIEYKPEPFNIKTFVEEVVSELFALCKEGQVFDILHQGPETVVSDPKLLKNILFNLISNAIKFSNEDSTITISSSLDDTSFYLTVKDAGIGISEEDCKHLFERFFRGQNATHIQGTGLGLSIVAKFTELMNGKLKFSSVLNKGTCIRLQFPISGQAPASDSPLTITDIVSYEKNIADWR